MKPGETQRRWSPGAGWAPLRDHVALRERLNCGWPARETGQSVSQSVSQCVAGARWTHTHITHCLQTCGEKHIRWSGSQLLHKGSRWEFLNCVCLRVCVQIRLSVYVSVMHLKRWHALVCVSPTGAVSEDPAAPPVSVSGVVLRRLSAQREPDWQSQRRVSGGTSWRSRTSAASESEICLCGNLNHTKRPSSWMFPLRGSVLFTITPSDLFSSLHALSSFDCFHSRKCGCSVPVKKKKKMLICTFFLSSEGRNGLCAVWSSCFWPQICYIYFQTWNVFRKRFPSVQECDESSLTFLRSQSGSFLPLQPDQSWFMELGLDFRRWISCFWHMAETLLNLFCYMCGQR